MATVGRDIESVELTEAGAVGRRPAATSSSRRCARKCPIHWTESFEEFPEEAGFWSVTTADDVHTVSRDWQTYSSELRRRARRRGDFPLELARAMFIGMDPPKHDRLKALFQRGFTPKRIADHEERDPGDRGEGARPARGPRDVRPRRATSPSRSSRA